MIDTPQITVELYGMPRQRAGRAEITLQARTLGELLLAVQTACPELTLLEPDGRIVPHIRISLTGQRFLTDPAEELPPGERVLILSADAGG
jgi:hypothetical protein